VQEFGRQANEAELTGARISMSNNPVPGLVRTILPEGFVNFSYYQSLARNEVEPCTPLQQEWFIWILKDKGPNVIDLTQRFAKAYPKV
jgi:hypothetical protein